MYLDGLFSVPGVIYLISVISTSILSSYVYSVDKNNSLRRSALMLFGLTVLFALLGLLRTVYPDHWRIITTVLVIVIFYIGFSWFYFISKFVTYDVDKRIIYFLFGAYTFLAIALVTDPIHGLFSSYDPVYYNDIIASVLLVPDSPFFLLLVGVTYPMFMFGLILLIREWMHTKNQLRKNQVIYVFIGSVVPIVLDFVNTVGVVAIFPVEPVLISFVVATVPSYMYAVLSYSFIEQQPLTREKIVQHIDEGVITVATDLTILDVNKKGLDLFNLDSTVNTDIEDFPESLQQEITQAVESDQEIIEKEIQVELNGDARWFNVKLVTVDLPADNDQIAITVSDITEEKERLEELIIKNKQLDQFSRVVSHDMGNYLNIGQSYLQLVKGQIELDDDLKDQVEYIEESFENISAVIEDASNMTDIVDGELTKVDFGEVVDEIIDQVDFGEVTVEKDINIVKTADKSSIRRLVENLVQNSLTHGGEDLSTIIIGELEEERGFYVADDGVGFDDTEQIFESGYTTSDTGSGLGLSISQTVVELHGWTITATECETGGARFEIIFDAEESNPTV